MVVGGTERVLEQHVARHHDTDLICFTDADVPEGSGWQVRPIAPRFPLDPSRSSRWPKLLPHLVLPDYDESLFIDNTVLLTADPAELFERFLPDGVGMAAYAHTWRPNLRAEFEEVVKVGKESDWVCREQLRHYEATDPEALELRPVAGGFLYRRHDDPVVQRAMQRWWEHVLRYSRRDQLSLLVAARAEGLEILVHEVDNHLSELHEWPRGAARALLDPDPSPLGPDAHIEELQADIARLTQEVASLQGALAQQEHEHGQAVLDAVTELREEYERSTSWRATRPLRAVSGLVRRDPEPDEA